MNEYALESENARLKAELAAAQKDAERYRWLRDGQYWPAAFYDHDEPEPLRGQELDAAIDKEIGK